MHGIPASYRAVHAPRAELARLVHGYWVIADLDGAHRDHPVITAPHLATVLTINVGRPCVAADAPVAMRASLLGIQSRARTWCSDRECYFAMIMLAPGAVARLFPACGPGIADRQLELGEVLGDRDARGLQACVAAARSPEKICAALERWLLDRLASVRTAGTTVAFERACAALVATGNVARAAAEVGVSIRQLERWCASFVGHPPQTLAGIARVQRSLRAVQAGRGDARDGFADQAHQIRAWRRHLGVTPGRYRPSDMSPLRVPQLAQFL